MNILQAIRHKEILRSFLADDKDTLKSWANWLTALRCLYGLPVTADASKQLVRDCTGRDADLLPEDGFRRALFLTGRRSGKSRIAAVIAAFEATLGFNPACLSKGEKGVVICVSPTKRQSKLVRDYIEAIFEIPIFAAEVVDRTNEAIELKNRIRIEVMSGDFRRVRGVSAVTCILDEACFLGLEDESNSNRLTDTALVQALEPSLMTTKGKLIAISSPYARRGWAYSTWQKNYGNNSGSALVWMAPSTTMNLTLSQEEIERRIADDPAAARSELLGFWRDDVGTLLSRDVVEALVVKGRHDLHPRTGVSYRAFVDMAGGGGTDSAVLCIGHRVGRKVIIDVLRAVKPKFNPYSVITEFCELLQRYKVTSCVGDAYAGAFPERAFADRRIVYEKCAKVKSQLYLDFISTAMAGEVELPDDSLLVQQLCGLERRTISGGRDKVDHPVGGSDDSANAVAGIVDLVGVHSTYVGGFDPDGEASMDHAMVSWGEEDFDG